MLCLFGFVIVAAPVTCRVVFVGVLAMALKGAGGGVTFLCGYVAIWDGSFRDRAGVGDVFVVAFSISSIDFRTGRVHPEGPAFRSSWFVALPSLEFLQGGVLNILEVQNQIKSNKV